MKLTGIGYPIVIRILPETQRSKDRVVTVDVSIGVSAVFLSIVLRERQKTVRGLGRLLRSVVSEQFASVINDPIAVSIEDEESVIGGRRSPREALGSSVSVEIEVDAGGGIRKIKPVPQGIDDNRGVVAFEPNAGLRVATTSNLAAPFRVWVARRRRGALLFV
ncbi:MAG TPA: hypothetical protein VF819_08695 [Nitrospira sp.]